MPRSKHRKLPRDRSRKRTYGFESPILGEDQKMSAVLLEFIAPYRDKAEDDAALERLISLGVIAWNIALLPESHRENSINEFASKLFTPSRINPRYWLGKLKVFGFKAIGRKMEVSSEIADFRSVITEMIERKIHRFDKNRRGIVSYEVNMTSDQLHVFVISTLQGL